MPRLITLTIVLMVTGAFLCAAAGSPFAVDNDPSHVTSELAFDSTAFAAGKPFMAAVTLTTRPDWHIYWSNPGESGLATSFKWTLPAGFKAEALPFPVPHTFVQPGGITGFGYSGKVTFLFKITPPETITDAHVLTVAANWLVCNKEQCVPGSKTLTSAPLEGPLPPGNKEFFATALASIPSETPPKDIFALATAPTPRGNNATEDWSMQLGWAVAVKNVEIFPPAREGLRFAFDAATTAGQPRQGPLMAVNRSLAASTQIDFKAHHLAGQPVKPDKIPLLVAYTLPDGTRKGFFLPLDPAALNLLPKP